MSRNIDWTKPLSAADRRWAEQFEGAHQQLLAANDAAHASAEVEAEELGDKPNYRNMKKQELVAEIERRNSAYDPEYHMSTEGTVPELVARLEEDDKADEE